MSWPTYHTTIAATLCQEKIRTLLIWVTYHTISVPTLGQGQINTFLSWLVYNSMVVPTLGSREQEYLAELVRLYNTLGQSEGTGNELSHYYCSYLWLQAHE